MWLMAVAAAWAGEPTIEVLDSGVVRGTIDVGASPEEIRALVKHPDALCQITSLGSEVSVSPEDDGDCRIVEMATPHPIMPVAYTARDCDTASGVTTRLVESRQLSRLQAEWKIEAQGERTVVTYDLDLRTNLPLPGFLVRHNTRKAVSDTLMALAHAYPAPAPVR